MILLNPRHLSRPYPDERSQAIMKATVGFFESHDGLPPLAQGELDAGEDLEQLRVLLRAQSHTGLGVLERCVEVVSGRGVKPPEGKRPTLVP